MEARQLREKATEALAKGRFSKAAELYAEYCGVEPKDYQARIRLGDAWMKAGRNDRAIEAYQAAAEGFAREGFLPRAIAVSKIVLELDPSHTGVQQMLADLYARRGGGADGGAARRLTPTRPSGEVPAVAPKAPPAPAAPPPPPAPAAAAPPPAPAVQAAPPPPPAPPVTQALRPSAPELEVEVVFDEPEETEEGTESPGVEVELDLADAETASAPSAPPPAPAAPAPGASLAPPGLRPRRVSDTQLPAVVDAPPAAPQPVPEPAPQTLAEDGPHDEDDEPMFPGVAPGASSFTELEIEADSLLHAVELAAQAGYGHHTEELAASGQEHDEPDLALSEEPAAETQPRNELPTIPLFSDLPRDAFIALFERCPLRRFEQGEYIIEQGSRGDAFYVICAGRVRVTRWVGEAQQDLATLPEGSFFGEMALLSGSPRSASVVADAEDTQVLEISAPVLAGLSRSYPQVARALRRFCRQRLLADVMNTSALFQSFDRKDRRELVEKFLARDARKGDAIVQEGVRADGLYVVLSGEVEVRKAGQVLAHLKEGELFGEMSLLNKAPATATVSATRRTSLLRLPREDFDTLILTHPQILALISDLTDTRARQTEVLLGLGPKAPMDGERFEDLILV
jgi:CRP-like cAMP-binding protein